MDTLLLWVLVVAALLRRLLFRPHNKLNGIFGWLAGCKRLMVHRIDLLFFFGKCQFHTFQPAERRSHEWPTLLTSTDEQAEKPQIFFIGILTRAVFLFDHFHLTARIWMRQSLEIELEKLYWCWFKKFSQRCDDGKCVWCFRDSFSPSEDLSVVI